MRFLVLALLVTACEGCVPTKPEPVPPPSGNPPPPVVADAGVSCATSCRSAIAECPKPALTQEQCAFRCSEGMAHLTGMNPTCMASELVCSSKKGCQ